MRVGPLSQWRRELGLTPLLVKEGWGWLTAHPINGYGSHHAALAKLQ
jgi:hypothetical protein